MELENLVGEKTSQQLLVDRSVDYLVDHIRQLDPVARIENSGFVLRPPETLLHIENRLGKDVTVHTGMHKMVIFVSEAVAHSQSRLAVGEEHPYRNFTAQTIEFSGPSLGSEADFMYTISGRNLTPEETEGINFRFLICSYDATKDAMIPVTGVNFMVHRLEREFVKCMKSILDHASEHGTVDPTREPTPVRTYNMVMAKIWG